MSLLALPRLWQLTEQHPPAKPDPPAAALRSIFVSWLRVSQRRPAPPLPSA